jgi:hypothetical protein
VPEGETKRRALREGGGPRSSRSLAKVGVFIAVILMLCVITKVTIAYQAAPAGLVPLPDHSRDKVTVVSIAGMMQMINSLSSEEEDFPTSVTVRTWNLSNGETYMQPMTSKAIGCENSYSNQLNVKVETANQLAQGEKAAVNVTVFESADGRVLATQLLILDLKPGEHSYLNARFDIMTEESDPVFLVRVSFPTQAELNASPLPTRQVPLFEYILIKLGIVAH